MIKVLIVDDSIVLRKMLERFLSMDPGISVVGHGRNGEEAMAFLKENRVDVVTMDIQMPEMDGFEATKRIVRQYSLPVVVVSSCWEPDDVEKTFRAIEAGAVAVLPKPVYRSDTDGDYGEILCRTVRDVAPAVIGRTRSSSPLNPLSISDRVVKAVAIGASTGGPQALADFLSRLPGDFPSPVLVVQHIAAGFLDGMARWLSQITPLMVRSAEQGERVAPGTVYLAPEGVHMKLSDRGRIDLTGTPPSHGVRPSVSILFGSVAETCGPDSVGIILSGMGSDGAVELKVLRDLGAVTFAQDRESSVIWGMPGEAVRLGAAEYVLPPDQIAYTLVKCARKS